MRCGGVRKKLMAYHDDELSGADRGRIEEHLNVCPVCSGILKNLVRADSVAGIPDPGSEYWNEFTDRVMASVKDEPIPDRLELGKPQVTPQKRSGPVFLRLVPALSVALVTVVAAGLYLEGRVKIVPRSDLAPVKARKAGPTAPGPSTTADKTAVDSGMVPPLSASKVQVSNEVARESYSDAKAASPIPASVLYARAESSFRAGDLTGAESLLRRLLVKYPSDPLGGKTSVLLARVLDRLNRPEEAEKVLSDGERMFPGDPSLARFRGQRKVPGDGTMER